MAQLPVISVFYRNSVTNYPVKAGMVLMFRLPGGAKATAQRFFWRLHC